MRKYYVIILCTLTLGCKNSKEETKINEQVTVEIAEIPVLNLGEANSLSKLP